MGGTETFWDFSVRTYHCEGVPAACLALQNQYGADVNVLLFCCWVGATRGEFETDSYESVMAFAHHWVKNVVRPLRGARTWMKLNGCPDQHQVDDQFTNLRERIKAVELEAEHLQQDLMQSLLDKIPATGLDGDRQINAAVYNLRHYCTAQDIGWAADIQQYLAVILQAAIPLAGDKAAAALATNMGIK